MHSTVMMGEMSWSEYERRLQHEDAIVFVPVGSLEQHGYHLPLGTDTLLATYMARRAAEALGGVVAAPIAYGYRSQVRTGGGQHRMGTVNLGATTLIEVVKDVLLEIVRHGARKIAVIDGHYENRFMLDEACHLASQAAIVAGISDLRIFKMIYAERISPDVIEEVYRGKAYPGLELEHAGLLETSMMLYCHPELVDMPRVAREPSADFPPYDMFPPRAEWVPPSGCLSCGAEGTAEAGRLLVEDFVKTVIASVGAEFRPGQDRREAKRAATA